MYFQNELTLKFIAISPDKKIQNINEKCPVFV